MTVKVPRRLIGMCLLFTMLCLTPATLPTAFAKPIPYDNPDPRPGPYGDGDGVVVKASARLHDPSYSATTTRAGGSMSAWRLVLEYLRLVRMGYGSRW